MQEISIIVLVSVLIDVWTLEFLMPQIVKESKIGKMLNWKPINCGKCLSFWSGLVLSIIFLNPIYMGIYIINKITT